MKLFKNMKFNHHNHKKGLISIISLVFILIILIFGYKIYNDSSKSTDEPFDKKISEQKSTDITTEKITEEPITTVPEKTEEKESVFLPEEPPEEKFKGIILVKSNSSVEKFAQELANQRNWTLISLKTNNPIEIKRTIVNVTTIDTTIGYLLIIGTDEQIPLEDKFGLIEYDKEQNRQGAVLDSLFYGNIDEDAFVELGVGRLPFDNEIDVRNYFKDLKIRGLKNQYVYYPIYEEISSHSLANNFCLSKEFNNTNSYIEPGKEEIVKLFNNARIFSIFTHGAPSFWALEEKNFSKEDIPSLYEARTIVMSFACSSAQQLGPEFIKKGAGAFFGQYFVTGNYGTTDNPIILSKKILSGSSLGHSLKEYLNYTIAEIMITNTFAYDKSGELVTNLDIGSSAIADRDIILYGDPSISIEKLTVNLPKIVIGKRNKEILIKIPESRLEKINKYNFHCYGGDNEANKELWLQEHIEKIINNGKTPTSLVGDFIFRIDNIDAIKDGKEIINRKEFEFKTIRNPFASLIMGNEERYLVIKEIITIDQSFFSNPREIILGF